MCLQCFESECKILSPRKALNMQTCAACLSRKSSCYVKTKQSVFLMSVNGILVSPSSKSKSQGAIPDAPFCIHIQRVENNDGGCGDICFLTDSKIEKHCRAVWCIEFWKAPSPPITSVCCQALYCIVVTVVVYSWIFQAHRNYSVIK